MSEPPAGKAPLPITLTTDFGLEDEFVGVMKVVIESVLPGATVIDGAHGVAPGDVTGGALALRSLVAYSPPAVHVAVVDPGVGSARRAVAAAAGDHILVGPDNGLLGPAAESLGGIRAAVEIGSSPFRLDSPHRTFHGRDVFAPVAAHLASGAALEVAGRPVEPESLLRLELPEPRLEEGSATATVLAVDRFGNLALNLGAEQLAGSFLREGATFEVALGSARLTVPFAAVFADVAPGEPLLLLDSSGRLALAVNGGSAAETFGAAAGEPVELALGDRG